MDTKITRRRAETRSKILDAAIGVFADRGVLGASVEEICERAGFTRGAFYSNYSSKNELVIAILELDRDNSAQAFETMSSEDAAQVIGELLGSHEGEVTRESLLKFATDYFMSQQKTDRDFLLVYPELRLYAARNPEVRDAFLKTHKLTMEVLSAQLDQVVEYFQISVTMPTRSFIENIAGLWDVIMLHAVMEMTPRMNCIADLPPEVLERVLKPLYDFVSGWAVDAPLLHQDQE